MGNKRIRLTESDLHRIVSESVRKILATESTPQYMGNAAEKAKNATTGLRGKFNKAFRKDFYDRKKRQATDLGDYSGNHPTDTWTGNLTDRYCNPRSETYKDGTIKNTRGETRYYNDLNQDNGGIRGKVVNTGALKEGQRNSMRRKGGPGDAKSI